MNIIITDLGWSKTRVVALSPARLAVAGAGILTVIAAASIAVYHGLFVQGLIYDTPIVGRMLAPQMEARLGSSRFLRENLDVLATRVGEMQVKIDTLEQLAGRVSTQSGVPVEALPKADGSGGALIGSAPPSLNELEAMLNHLDEVSNARLNYFAQIEARLFDEKVRNMLIPTQMPIPGASLGSPFGWRRDPFTGRSAMHTGLDFASPEGTQILAAAGGIVVTQEWHNAYGNMIEVDHGNSLVSRYAHTSRVHVKKGELITRGQLLAEVGSTGRSTGPHLHFEVLLSGVHQDPRAFLEAGDKIAGNPVANGAVRARLVRR